MATSILEILIQAKDEASAKLGALGKKAEELEPAFKQMSVAGGIAFASISAFAVSAIKDAGGAETAQNQLEHAVLQVSKATKEQLRQTEQLADALEKKGVLDGDNIKVGLAQLSTFGLSNKAVQGLGKSLSDLAVNQFGVNASGDQLAQSANMIAKALNGQFGVLEKSGIRFSEAQIKMIKFGSEMDKVKAINEGFAQNLKYTNETALKGIEGQLAKASVEFGNMKEAIGAQLIPVVTQLMSALLPIVNKITEWVQANPELTKNLVLVGLAISGIVTAIGLLGIALPAVIAGLGFFTATTLPIIGIIVALGVAIYSVVGIMDILLNHGAEVLLGIQLYWQDFVTWLKKKVVDPIKQYFTDVWAGVKIIFKESLDGLIEFFNPLFAVLDRVKNAISSAFGAVKGAVTSTVSFFTGNARALGGSVMSNNSYLVGENGPEIFTPSVTGSILPNASVAGGGGITININGGTYLSETVANDIGDMIMNRFKRTYRI